MLRLSLMYQKKTKSQTKISKEDKLKDAVHKLKRVIEQQRKYIKQLEEQLDIDNISPEDDTPSVQEEEQLLPLCNKCHAEIVVVRAGVFTIHHCLKCGHKYKVAK